VYARRVRRMIRRFDPWSVLKVSLVFNLCLAAVTLVAGTIVYNLARVGGFMARIERAMQEVGFENFRFIGTRTIMAAFLILTGMAIFMTAATVLLSFIYNLISEVVGGLEISTLDELVDVVDSTQSEISEAKEEGKSRLPVGKRNVPDETAQDAKSLGVSEEEPALNKRS